MNSDELCLIQMAQRITERRKKLGYTQEVLAEKTEYRHLSSPSLLKAEQAHPHTVPDS